MKDRVRLVMLAKRSRVRWVSLVVPLDEAQSFQIVAVKSWTGLTKPWTAATGAGSLVILLGEMFCAKGARSFQQFQVRHMVDFGRLPLLDAEAYWAQHQLLRPLVPCASIFRRSLKKIGLLC